MEQLYFVESPLFTEQLVAFGISDEDLNKLQQSLMQNPECGDMIVGTGGGDENPDFDERTW